MNSYVSAKKNYVQWMCHYNFKVNCPLNYLLNPKFVDFTVALNTEELFTERFFGEPKMVLCHRGKKKTFGTFFF